MMHSPKYLLGNIFLYNVKKPELNIFYFSYICEIFILKKIDFNLSVLQETEIQLFSLKNSAENR